MNSLKRPASESNLPPRHRKHRRLSINSDPEPPLSSRWAITLGDLSSLMFDTLGAAAGAALKAVLPGLPDESGTPTAEEATSSTSPLSSSMISTPRQTSLPPPIKTDERSTPTHTSTSDNLIPSFPRPRAIWRTPVPTLSDDSIKIFGQAHLSTPKASLMSFTPSNRTTPGDSSPNRVLKRDILPGMQKLELEQSSQTPQTPDNRLSSDLPPGHAQSRGKREEYIRSRKARRHIFIKAHKARVKLETIQQQKEFQERYKKSRVQGFKSSSQDFKEYLDYQLAIAPHVSPSSSRPNTGLFSTKIDTRGKGGKEDYNDYFLKRVLENAKATLNERQAPKPNIPGFEELEERRFARERLIERRLRQPPLPDTLPKDKEKQVDHLLRKTGIISKFAREQVSHQDIYRLHPRQWLNDEIVNFYGAMILARSEERKGNTGALPEQNKGKARKQKEPLNIHYFSSFFWQKYTEEGYEKGRLAKWTKKVDIFSKDAILIPVNHGNAHWTAGSINFRLKRIESYDSMGMADKRVCNVLRQYLDEEHKNKKKKSFDFDGWTDWYPKTTPQQENGYDCGVFTCQFLESLSRGEDFFNFSQENMHYLRRKMIWEIGNAKFLDSS